MPRLLNALAGVLVGLYVLLRRTFDEQIARRKRGEPVSERQRQSLRRLVLASWAAFGAFTLLGLWQLARHGYLPVAAAFALLLMIGGARMYRRILAILEKLSGGNPPTSTDLNP
jgi:hypothetical protein